METTTPAPTSDAIHTRDLVTIHQRETALLRLVGALTRYQGLLQPAAGNAEVSAAARDVHERTHDAERAYGYTSKHLEDVLSLDDLVENAELPTWPPHHTADGRWCLWSDVDHSARLTTCPAGCSTSPVLDGASLSHPQSRPRPLDQRQPPRRRQSP